MARRHFDHSSGSSCCQPIIDQRYRSVVSRSSAVRIERSANLAVFFFACLASTDPSQSLYTSALRNTSLTFCRTGSCSTTKYYYEPIGIRAAASGLYILQSVSYLDTYGYIFNSTVRQITNASEAVASNHQGAGNSQFRFVFPLEAMFNYTLVFTTYTANTRGPFSIRAIGPLPITFFTLWIGLQKSKIDAGFLTPFIPLLE
jgi:hypothetical protein